MSAHITKDTKLDENLYSSHKQATNDLLMDSFLHLIKKLQKILPIDRALYVCRQDNGNKLLATASYSNDKTRRNLSLIIPKSSSFFDKVAEDGLIFTEEFCEFFSGNRFEKNLLLGDDSESYTIIPIKQESEVIGLVGLSSTTPGAFVTIEETVQEMEISELISSIAYQTSQLILGK